MSASAMSEKAVVFCGMSVSTLEAAQISPGASIRPPISRGQLYAVREEGAEKILIIDGIFNQRLAISPREIIDVLRDGATIVGASSMGALRAAECWPAGMEGHGTIFRLYRAGLLESDDEVAVASVAELDFRAVTVPLINVRYTVYRARCIGLLSREEGRKIVAAAKALHFSERRWKRIFSNAKVDTTQIDGGKKNWFEIDLKRKDALLTLEKFNHMKFGRARSDQSRFARPVRYTGCDPLLGRPQDEATKGLLRWLFGTGRYQRYIWPVIISLGLANNRNVTPSDHRESLIIALQAALEAPGRIGRLLWAEAEYMQELSAELMRWHAHEMWSAADANVIVTEPVRSRVREEIAIAHGYRSWRWLKADVHDDCLFGAIPMDWIEEAVSKVMRSRINADSLLPGGHDI